MKFTVVTYGTEGDTRPLAGLSRALMDNGHETLMLADSGTFESIHALNVPVQALSGDIRENLAAGMADSNTKPQKSGFRDTAKLLANIANENTEAWMAELLASARGSDAIIFSGMTGFVALSVAERLNIPAIGAALIPMTPTREFPSPFLPPSWVLGWLNRVSHNLVNGMFWRAFKGRLNEARSTVCGLPARNKLWTNFPLLYGISPSLLPQPADWPAHVRMCGQWLQPAGSWIPPNQLEDFLRAGPPPLYIGFGSMSGFDQKQMLDTLVRSLNGRRALFYPGWNGLEQCALPSNILAIGNVPHDWLFPQTAAVIHHGGVGTTHSATRAGKPSIVVPFIGDQFFWADRLAKLGIAPAPVSVSKLNAPVLTKAIEYAEHEEVKARAAELGDAMSKENGLAMAVRIVQDLCRN